MDTRASGDLAEAAVLTALTRAGLAVWLPWSRFGASDLVAETPARQMLRVQVKSARFREGCAIANCRSTDHGSGRQSYLGLVDVIAIHVPAIDQQFVIPVEEAHGFEIRLRVKPTRNNQRRRVRLAADYRLADWAARVCGTATTPANVSASSA